MENKLKRYWIDSHTWKLVEHRTGKIITEYDEYLVKYNDHKAEVDRLKGEFTEMCKRTLKDIRQIDWADAGHFCESKKVCNKLYNRFENFLNKNN